VVINGYCISGYWWILMVILLMAIGGYFIDGYLLMTIMDILLMDIDGYFIDGYWWIFYWWIMMVILLMVIAGYFIGGY